MPLFTPFAVKDDLQPLPTKSKSMKIDHPLAERTFMLFRRDGTSFAVTVRLGAPFVGNTPPAHPEYRCAVQILGIGDDRVIAPWGEDSFVALQYAIDLIGQMLDDLVRRENLEIRFQR